MNGQMNHAKAPSAVEIRGLCKWYEALQVLHDVDLSIAKRERLVICGPGSGQNMGVIFVVAARAKVSSLRVGLPWTYGLQSKLPSTTGRSALISLTAFHDPTG